ncbi:MAG TPA: polysaccharide biosynthesis/export family protein [Beijerinckiaceae bacterium]|nr:polysaccharide biosynthesis/export family protein [Beijerinckiaceae bacterium]
MRRSILAFVLLLTGWLAGCAPPHYAVFDTPQNAPYTLGSGDRLRVIVFGQDSLSNTYAVDGTGNISMPLIGLVRARGLTTATLEHAIAERLRNGFLRDPQVSVEVEAYRPFFVLGEVTTAGQYPFINGMTVENAVAVAGGFTPRAYKWSAELTRVINGVPVVATVPITQPVQPGDTVTIRERFF